MFHFLVVQITKLKLQARTKPQSAQPSNVLFIVLDEGSDAFTQSNRHEVVHILTPLTSDKASAEHKWHIYYINRKSGPHKLFRFLIEILRVRPEKLLLATWNPRDVSFNHPSVYILSFIKKSLPLCSIILIGYDTTNQSFWHEISSFAFLDLVLPLDNPNEQGLYVSKKGRRTPIVRVDQIKHVPSPHNLQLLKSNISSEKYFDIAFFGRAYSYRDYRLPFIEKLQALPGKSIISLTGLGNPKFTNTEMYQHISASRIGINFSLSISGSSQLKGRVWETLLLRTFLLEQENLQISHYFSANIHYATFSCPDSLVDQIKFFLKHDRLRENIALAGHKRAIELQESGAFQKLVTSS